MWVEKRDGRREQVKFDKIANRLRELSNNILRLQHCDPMLVAQKVIGRVYSGVTTTEIDEIAAETAASMSIDHHDYALLAVNIIVWNLHKNIKSSFSETIKDLYNNVTEDRVSGNIKREPLIADDVYELIIKNAELLDSEIIHDRDYEYDYFGLKTLETSCLLKVEGKVVERPQHMLMRAAIGIHKDDIVSAIKTYHLMSQHWFIHSPSTLLNAGTTRSQLSGCSLVSMEEDSIEGSPACAFAGYLELWHYNILEFTDRRNKHRRKEKYALCVPDLFMRRLKEDAEWSLFCPSEAPGLGDSWGQEFEDLYKQYEREGKGKKVVSSRRLWGDILISQFEFGAPFVLFKDTCNRRSNQMLGIIKSSKLCTEITECTAPNETAVFNSASIALPRCVMMEGVPIESQPPKLAGSSGSENRYFDFDKLAEVTSFVTTNLNKVIDINYSPVGTAKKPNLRRRQIGIDLQGLADTFILLGIPFDSPEAKQLNKDILETIYYHALKASSELAALEGPYETYQGSPVSKGILQPDIWGVTPSDRWDWAALRQIISRNGIRNSQLVAPMPTASTRQILCNNECFEPYTSNIYKCGVLSGEFDVVNKHLLHDLTEMGLWSSDLKNKIISDGGSVLKISKIADDLKAIYRTVFEINQKTLVDMAIDRGCYIDQSQILNIHLHRHEYRLLTSLHHYAWSKGVNTVVCVKSYDATLAIKRNSNEEDGDWSAKKARFVRVENREEGIACGS